MTIEKTRVLILGGTGTLGRALTKEIIDNHPEAQITILSRDEHKQAAMKREFPQVRFVLGDIRDYASVARHVEGQEIVFHVAALKHVDILEENVAECIKTNVEGTINAADAAAMADVKHFIFSSTDKAVDPINAYGMAKGLAERYLYSLNADPTIKTKFSVYRWGNVIGSNGSAIPLFAKALKEQKEISITDPAMTRFWLPIEWAVRFMLLTFRQAHTDCAMICPNMKAASVFEVVKATAHVVGRTGDVAFKVIGLRPGEKIHEEMISRHDGGMSSELADRYTFEELCELIRPAAVNA
jgi:UDP-N-acetylglucosamine 4,6-dehydratase